MKELTLNMPTIYLSPSPRYEICPLYLFLPHPDHPKTCQKYFFEGFSGRLGVSVTNGVILRTIVTFFSGFLTRTKTEQGLAF